MRISNSRIVVHKPSELSVPWAQHIVNRFAKNASVSNVNVHSVDVGTSTRLRVEVEHDAQDIVPKRWFIKTPSLAFKSRLITAMPRFLHKEVSFYRSFSGSVPLKLPRILAAESRFGLVIPGQVSRGMLCRRNRQAASLRIWLDCTVATGINQRY